MHELSRSTFILILFLLFKNFDVGCHAQANIMVRGTQATRTSILKIHQHPGPFTVQTPTEVQHGGKDFLSPM